MSHTYSACPSCHAINKVSIEKINTNQAVCGKCSAALSLHGLVSSVNTDEFHKILRVSDKPVIVDFWASWCGPCKMYGPEFERASKQNTNAVFIKINTETEQHLSAQLGIRGIPCTIIFKNGQEVKRQSGAMSADQVSGLINSVR